MKVTCADGLALCAAGSGYWLFTHVKSELSPTEDRGTLQVQGSAPEGASFGLVPRWAKSTADRAKAINADLVARVALLELQNEKMRRALYGQRSERGQLLIDQLELGLEELEASAGEDEALGQRAAAGTPVEAFTRTRPSRKPLPAHLPRERVVVAQAGRRRRAAARRRGPARSSESHSRR